MEHYIFVNVMVFAVIYIYIYIFTAAVLKWMGGVTLPWTSVELNNKSAISIQIVLAMKCIMYKLK
jgi:hypothetical protein